MRLIIIRHAEPDYEIDSLTEKGWREAEILSQRLLKTGIDHIYCSPLGRAKDTASVYLKKTGKNAVICDWLREFSGYIIDQNGLPHRPWDQLPSLWTTDEEHFDKDSWLLTPLMQSGDVKKEYTWVCEQLDELLASHGYKKDGSIYRVERENDDTVVLFCHFGVECVLLSHILNISPMQLWHGFVALPSSVTILTTEERREGIAYFRCSSFGDLSHLYSGDEEPSFAARFCETFSSEDRH